LLQSTGSLEAALTEYRKTISLKPDLAEAHLSFGQALGDAGRLDAAIAEFREVLRLKPGHAEAQQNLETAETIKRGARQ
jgi:tetratricopeptide (TPR) repeat protein